MRVDNQPYGRVTEIIYDQASRPHPYRHATIGSMKDLEAASVDDVRDFYRTYYVPANAHGGHRRRLRCTAGEAARRPVSRPRAEGRARGAAPTSRRSRRRRRRSASRWKSRGRCRRSWVAYHITYDGHPDSYPLHIASKVLSDGESSRIYRKLVYQQQIAVAAFGEQI